MLLISIWKWCCMWLVLVPICWLYCLHFFYLEILLVACGHFLLLFQLLEGSNSTLWLHNIHHRPLVMWYSICIECQWLCVRGKLWGILYHHVPWKVVLHMHHQMCLYKPCSISSNLDSVRFVLGWWIPSRLRKHGDGLVSNQMLLVDGLVKSGVLLFLQCFLWIFL